MMSEVIGAVVPLTEAPGGRGFGPGMGPVLLWGTLNLLFWVAIILGALWLVIRLVRSGDRGKRDAPGERILAERYARGEIDTDEYQQRLAVLQGQSASSPQ